MNDTERQIYEWWVAQREKLERGMAARSTLWAEQEERAYQADRQARQRAEARRVEQEAEEEERRCVAAHKAAEDRAAAHKEAERRRVAAAKRAKEYVILEREKKAREQEKAKKLAQWLDREHRAQAEETMAGRVRRRFEKSERAQRKAAWDQIERDEVRRRLAFRLQSEAQMCGLRHESRVQAGQVRMAARYAGMLAGEAVPFSEMEEVPVWIPIYDNRSSLHSVAGEPQAGSELR